MSAAAAMQGVSRDSFAASRDNLDALVRTGGEDLAALADDLFAVTSLLDHERGLRRALTDPARSGADRAELARAVFGDRVSATTLDLVVATVRARWSVPRDLSDTLELLGAEALVASAEQGGRLDAVEDELFRIGRIVAGEPTLRVALADGTVPGEHRVELIQSLLRGKASDETLWLVSHAVQAPRGRPLDRSLEELAEVAAQRRSRLVATVTAAVPLTEEQRQRLTAALAALYGHQVHLNIEVEPALVGGIRVELGDEVIDGSVLSRLDAARRRLTG